MSETLRYAEGGEVHLDFHGATNTTIDFVIARYGVAAMDEIFRKVGQATSTARSTKTWSPATPNNWSSTGGTSSLVKTVTTTSSRAQRDRADSASLHSMASCGKAGRRTVPTLLRPDHPHQRGAGGRLTLRIETRSPVRAPAGK